METLVLSQSYEPMDRVSWQRAITLWWTDKVEILEEYDDRAIRGADFSMPMPCVVRFVSAVRKRKRSIRFSRQNVYARDKGRCAYCALDIALSESTYDHVVPRRLGGRTTWENIVICCQPCNQKKGGRLPEQARMKLRTAPVKPRSLPPVERGVRVGHEIPVRWKPYLGIA